MGNTGSARPVGLRANLGAVAGDISLRVLPKTGPFTAEHVNATQPLVRVGDLWAEQPVVIHLLRRFG